MYLLDTNICIYIIKEKPAPVLKVLKKKIKDSIGVSSITVAELQYGVEKSGWIEKNRVALLEFLSIFTIIHFDDKDAVEFGKIKAHLEREGRIIGPMDLLISAHARSKNMTLVTNNMEEFGRINGLKLENWALR
ncbi:MAG TPA: type II toxin-antitoxin system VapC family toxin [Spirochaetota bacterium]|nr:type II toxin-antitoxin system VapC family toxin [Spirochaetota bacterium]HPC42654.1 type II toxin-antitoxin system VapC family toxin [Spirochaetota bacterium]HPL16251.1 type II toxin-antitoxin system VapC family toxin [Spirochaetota bacterium]HQF08426.1 type II toxin-antitoxin system VapC family toxin [Spirochaetota bacterium]HQH99064.1 type II toxin-antitoxin system VapC family toxin [Spirochaetota bacterium]